MPARLFANAVASSTCASAITSSQTTITLQSTSGFPVPGSGQQFSATILDTGNPAYNPSSPLATPYEYVFATGNNQGTNTLTVQRGQAGTSARGFFAGATVSATLLADDLVGAFMRIDLPYFARVHQNASQAIGAGGNGLPIHFDTVDEDPNNNWSAVNWNYTAPVAGRYEIKFHVKFQPPTTTGGIFARLYVNGTTLARHFGDIPGLTTAYVGFAGSTRLKLNANDTVQLNCGSGTLGLNTQTADAVSAVWMEIYFVGAP